MINEAKPDHPVVNAHNEWDPLEEVIVGILEGALVPPWDVIMPATVHKKELWDFYKVHGGTPWPEELMAGAYQTQGGTSVLFLDTSTRAPERFSPVLLTGEGPVFNTNMTVDTVKQRSNSMPTDLQEKLFLERIDRPFLRSNSPLSKSLRGCKNQENALAQDRRGGILVRRGLSGRGP
jgi:hypothetical protein